MKTMNILFVCKNNRFRSKIAEAYFKKVNKNKKIKASSAGLLEGFPTPKGTIDTVRKLKVNINGKPRAMSSKLLSKQDLIVIVASDVPRSVFFEPYVKKVVNWRVKDTEEGNGKEIIKITKKIIKKVDKLNKELEKGKW